MLDAYSIELPYRIKASRKKAALVLLISCAFVAVGIFMLKASNGEESDIVFVAWACILLFGLGIPLAVTMLVTRLPALVLSEQGFTIESWFGRKHTIAWSDVAAFGVWSFKANKWVGYLVARPENQLTNAERMSRQLSGFDGAIDSGTLKVEELADLMNALRARFVQSN